MSNLVAQNYILYVDKILNSINSIEKYTINLSKEVFAEDRLSYDAVLYNLHKIAELAQKLPEDIINKYQQVNWKDIIVFHKLVDLDYIDDFNIEVIWNAVIILIPPLKETMIQIERELDLKI
jgi:uncharacterized protein with HEPN domain